MSGLETSDQYKGRFFRRPPHRHTGSHPRQCRLVPARAAGRESRSWRRSIPRSVDRCRQARRRYPASDAKSGDAARHPRWWGRAVQGACSRRPHGRRRRYRNLWTHAAGHCPHGRPQRRHNPLTDAAGRCAHGRPRRRRHPWIRAGCNGDGSPHAPVAPACSQRRALARCWRQGRSNRRHRPRWTGPACDGDASADTAEAAPRAAPPYLRSAPTA